jgi:DNA invertase Pin-like site-specific DNA recombinase
VQTGAEQPYAGLRLAFLPRNSTPRQDGNYSQQRQRYSIAQHIEDGGGTPVPYDEGIASGRDLGKRPDALRALEDVEAGRLDGLAWETLDRVTRDEHGTDAGVIAETLGRRRALLVTLDRDFRLWRRQDLRDFKRETAESGDELLKIRDRLWGGVLEKAKDEPFFMGVPPYGYTTTLERRANTGKRGGTDVKRIPAKDERAADVMQAVADALNECTALGEAAYRLNAKGHFRQAVAGELAGAPMAWRAEDLRRILDKQIYGGWWTLGVDSDGSSSIWERSPVGANRGGRVPALEVPHLAWFSPEQLDVWRTKYAIKADRSGPRHRKSSFPLRNVLHCVSCGCVLVGYRQGLYTCPKRNSNAIDRLCAAPQFLTERGAVKAMLAELPNALAAVKYRREELALAAMDDDGLDALRRKRDIRTRQIEALTAQTYTDDWDGTPVPAVDSRIKQWQKDVGIIEGLIADREQFVSRNALEDHVVTQVLRDPVAVARKLPESERIGILRLIFGAVKIKAEGWGSGRTYQVVDYRNLLVSSEVTPGSAGAPSVYHTICFYLGKHR